MVDYFLRKDLPACELAGAASSEELVIWAERMARRAEPRDIYREKEGRKTLRVLLGQQPVFLKWHSGIGWREVFKNLLQGRLPVVAASNEYRAVRALHKAGVDTLSLVAYARVGRNPAHLRSMIVSDELSDTISLEDYCADWSRYPPKPAVRFRLIQKVADSARRMHAAGINHRDFYLCHFHLASETLYQPSLRCYLIDLHRAQLRRRTPRRWRVKDLAGLYFSAMECGLSRRDLLRFIRHYSQGDLRRALTENTRLWRQVERRALQLHRKGLPIEKSSGPSPGQSAK